MGFLAREDVVADVSDQDEHDEGGAHEREIVEAAETTCGGLGDTQEVIGD